jgi:CRP-like cAMP-binding protein
MRDHSIIIIDQEDDTHSIEELSISGDGNDHRRRNHHCRHDANFYKKYTEINRLGAGNAFGDMSLMGSKPRMASIRCLEETHFAVLSKQDFNNVLG